MSHGALFVESSTTRQVAPHERADYWSELVSSYHRSMSFDFPRRDDFHGTAVRQRTDHYQLVGWQADDVVYRRATSNVREDSDDDYRLVLPTIGQIAVQQHGHEAKLQPGNACLLTMDQPFVLAQGNGTQTFVMTIPRNEVDQRLNQSTPLVRQLDLTAGLGHVVSILARELFQERATLTRHQFDSVSSRLVELLCILVGGGKQYVTVSSHLAEVESAVRRYVREHVDDPYLDGNTIAHALGWSIRQIQLALQRVGTTPRDLIREERLRLAYERLQNPAYHHWTITAMAHQLGFCSISAFSTAFRKRYDLKPRDVRSQ